MRMFSREQMDFVDVEYKPKDDYKAMATEQEEDSGQTHEALEIKPNASRTPSEIVIVFESGRPSYELRAVK